MRLTVQTDYALRVLMYLSVREGHHTIEKIAKHYAISKNHLMKVAQRLVATNYIESVRGRGGGLAMIKAADEINLGEMVRHFEDIGTFVECYDSVNNQCLVTSACGLKHILAGALQSFFGHLDQYTIADLVTNESLFTKALNIDH